MRADALRALEARWHDEIPITGTMGVRVHAFDGHALEIVAALAPNLNIHGTAFAGSLFSVAALCGWGQVYLQLEAAGLAGSIVFVEGRIRCLAPARADMLARSTWTHSAAEQLDRLRTQDRTRVHLDTQVTCNGTVVAEFSGEYGVRLADAPQRSR